MIPVPEGDHEAAVFENLDLTGAELRGTTLLECRFVRCRLGGAVLRGCLLTGTSFEECDLASMRLTDSALRGVRFRDCRATGIDWTAAHWQKPGLADPVSFYACTLDLSTFLETSLREARFIGCSAREVDFSGADLTGADFSGTDLSGAVFRDTDLSGADLRTARGYAIDVTMNHVLGMRAALPDAIVLLTGLGVEVEGL